MKNEKSCLTENYDYYIRYSSERERGKRQKNRTLIGNECVGTLRMENVECGRARQEKLIFVELGVLLLGDFNLERKESKL